MVGVPKKKRLQPYDRFLKNFQYRNALDAALKVCMWKIVFLKVATLYCYTLAVDNVSINFFSIEALARH